jgi:hypothetical protein
MSHTAPQWNSNGGSAEGSLAWHSVDIFSRRKDVAEMTKRALNEHEGGHNIENEGLCAKLGVLAVYVCTV